mmetsp:Transcript_9872/g.12301  ORF Transcript_9872/g.12301 Transcript_9872/m.12301 type:complete len:245 (-) Transcript_9872:301-1035(-)
MKNLKETGACLLFTHKTSSDVLHEDGEVLPEPGALLSEERRLRDASWVDGAKGDARGAMETLVQHVGSHHQGQLGVLVHLGTVEVVAVHHGDGFLAAQLQAIQLLQVSDWVDSTATHCVVISSYRPNHAHACVVRLRHHGHHFGGQEKLAQVIDLQLLFMPIHGPLWVAQGWLIYRCVADQPIDGTIPTELVQLLGKIVDRVETREVEVHGSETVHVKALELRNNPHLLHVAHGANDVIVTCSQ